MPQLEHRTREPRARLAAAILVGTAVTSAAVTAALILLIDRPHRWGMGVWLSDFAKSPGLAGVCAVGAALLALFGILRQVETTRRAQRAQQDSEQRRAWWTSFEWVAARAVPIKPDDHPLPYDAVLSSLTALSESASDAVQQRAVGAITEVASRAEAAESDVSSVRTSLVEDDGPPSVSGSANPQTRQRTLDAMRAYSAATANTPAESPLVDARVYEANVMDALARLAPEGRVTIQPSRKLSQRYILRPDAVVTIGGRSVVVEVKAYTNPGRPVPQRTLAATAQYVEAFDAAGAVIVAPVRLSEPPAEMSRPIRTAQWNTQSDDDALLAAIRDVSLGG